MLDAVPVIGPRVFCQRTLVGAEKLLDGGIAHGVHADLEASEVSTLDVGVELLIREIQHALGRRVVRVWL